MSMCHWYYIFEFLLSIKLNLINAYFNLKQGVQLVCSADKVTLGGTSTWRKASTTSVNYIFIKNSLIDDSRLNR